MIIKFIKEFSWQLDILKNDPEALFYILNSEAGRGGGRNVQFIYTIFLLIMIHSDLKFNIAVFRKQNKDLKEIWNDFEEWLPIPWDVQYKGAESLINGNKITFNSLYTSNGKVTSLGKSMKAGGDVMIVWIDEATEITNDDIYKIRQSYARFGKKLIILKSWNTWSPYIDCVKHMADYMPYPGVDYMKKHHYQIKKVHSTMEIRGKEEKVVEYFMRNSAYLNPFSSAAHIANLEAIAKVDPDEGNTILWAKPGVVDGAVYKNIDKAIMGQEELNNTQFKQIIAGVDFGISDATTVSLVGLSTDVNYRTDKMIVLDEYYHENQKGKVQMDINAYANAVIDFLLTKYENYNVAYSDMPYITVKVDYARQSSNDDLFVEVLKQRALELGVGDILIFEKAKKDKIRDRITLTNYLISTGRLKFVKGMTENLIREMSTSNYDTSKILPDGGHPRMDGDDHILNAFEYALSEVKDELHTPYTGL